MGQCVPLGIFLEKVTGLRQTSKSNTHTQYIYTHNHASPPFTKLPAPGQRNRALDEPGSQLEWRKWDLLTGPFPEPAQLMETMKQPPRYLSACQDEAHIHAPAMRHSTFSDTLRWQTGTWMSSHRHTDREAGGSLWRGLHDTWCLLILIVYCAEA